MLKPIAQAGKADLPALAETLALAFQDDPAVSWIFPDATRRAAKLPGMFNIIVPGDLDAGIALRSPGGEAVTLWRAPGRSHTGKLEQIRQLIPLLRTFGSALGRAIRIADAIEAHHPNASIFHGLDGRGHAAHRRHG